MLIFGFAAEPLLSAAFGDDLTAGASALPWLGLAMILLACTYLAVQYMLALGRSVFIWALAVAAAVEVPLVAHFGDDLRAVAVALCGLELACAAVVVTTAVYGGRAGRVRQPASGPGI
jgi:hypothetical protein